ncbi:hydroxymethylpyrimidine/phosphomethylpyrimidine kinase [Arcticibacter sp.]|jgi:hydroxymethylpyrimidine/phosphomethylpyrimidine kinase|uniref:hydroxymethylpyrimidine/phosphomethylpyrimidine kinase n=1 Tax=Arcticibacter sp. TaxID=1872630 RepID=UPI0038905AC1
MEYARPIVLSIAGLDPCGGAGLLADIKTIEQHKCLGFGVTTAITCQTENRFYSVKWIAENEIICQIEPLLEQYKIAAVKIGLVQSTQILYRILHLLTARGIPNIVWDPVLSASAGFHFNNHSDAVDLPKLLKKITLITPNLQEAIGLSKISDPVNAAYALADHTTVLLKGGHAPTDVGTDHLFIHSRKISLPPVAKLLSSKHGSGCILSSSIAAFLAKGGSLESACTNAKRYIEKALASNSNLLTYHHV